MNEPEQNECGWELEWLAFMDETEEHVEFKGEGTMADSLRQTEESGYATHSK